MRISFPFEVEKLLLSWSEEPTDWALSDSGKIMLEGVQFCFYWGFCAKLFVI